MFFDGLLLMFSSCPLILQAAAIDMLDWVTHAGRGSDPAEQLAPVSSNPVEHRVRRGESALCDCRRVEADQLLRLPKHHGSA